MIIFRTLPRKTLVIIRTHWFDECRKIGIKLPFCRQNEFESCKFMKKLNTFTCWKFNFSIIWQTRKTEPIFNLKDKNTHLSTVVYQGTCSCGMSYIGETSWNFEVRVDEHSDPNK